MRSVGIGRVEARGGAANHRASVRPSRYSPARGRRGGWRNRSPEPSESSRPVTALYNRPCIPIHVPSHPTPSGTRHQDISPNSHAIDTSVAFPSVNQSIRLAKWLARLSLLAATPHSHCTLHRYPFDFVPSRITFRLPLPIPRRRGGHRYESPWEAKTYPRNTTRAEPNRTESTVTHTVACTELLDEYA